jgi:hypothetical protein
MANKQAQTNFYYKQVRRVHPELLDWYNADTLHDSVLIPEHFEPGPTRPAPGLPTNLTGRAWAEILKPAKNFLARARPEMLF